MKSDASDRLERLLAVFPLFDGADDVTHEELERRTGIAAATLLDDLRALTERVDEPGGFVESVGIDFEHDRVAIRSSHFRRPTRLTVGELCALELGLALVAAATPPDERSPIDAARRRLRAAIVTEPASAQGTDGWHAESPAPANDMALKALREAVRGSRKAVLTYRRGTDTVSTTRVVRPYAVVPANGTWFLIAHCEKSDGLRLFRADRIDEATVLSEAFTPPLDRRIDDLLPRGKPYLGATGSLVTIRYSSRVARWIAEREGVSLDPDGSVTIGHPLGDMDWAVRHALQYGPEAEVLEPRAVREAIVARLREAISGAKASDADA